MKATESMKSYWKQALVAVLIMGGLVAVTATPARALSLWGPTKADGSPSHRLCDAGDVYQWGTPKRSRAMLLSVRWGHLKPETPWAR